jgi:hypothetical protein
MATRAEKWAAKLSGSARKQRYDAQKPQMVRLEAEATEALVKIEKEVKQMVQGEPVILLPYYIIFGKELHRLITHHTDKTLINEAIILEQKWSSRGLKDFFLDRMKHYYIQPYVTPPAIPWFRLDISLLDGPDIMA